MSITVLPYDVKAGLWIYTAPDGGTFVAYGPDQASAAALISATLNPPPPSPDDAVALAEGLVTDGVITSQEEAAIFPPAQG